MNLKEKRLFRETFDARLEKMGLKEKLSYKEFMNLLYHLDMAIYETEKKLKDESSSCV